MYYLKIAPREAIGCKPHGALDSAGKYLSIESETRSINARKVGPLNDQQIAFVREPQKLVNPFKKDRLRLPENTPTQSRAGSITLLDKVASVRTGLGLPRKHSSSCHAHERGSAAQRCQKRCAQPRLIHPYVGAQFVYNSMLRIQAAT